MQEKKFTAVVCAGGGAGKSTVTVNLGAATASRGLKTVLADMNMGMRTLDLYTGLEDRVLYTAADIMKGSASAQQVMLSCPGVDNLFLVPASQTKLISNFSDEELAAFRKALSGAADQVFIDTPPGIGEDLRRILRLADRVILICTPETASVRSADHLRSVVEEEGIRDILLVVSRYPVLPLPDPSRCEEIRELIPLPVAGVLPEEKEAVPVLGLRQYEKGSLCSIQIESIVRRLLGYEGPDAPISLFSAAARPPAEDDAGAAAGQEQNRAGKQSLMTRIRNRLSSDRAQVSGTRKEN